MRLSRNLGLSRRALLQHRVRTALAISGTGVGVAAVLVMVAIGEGAERRFTTEIEAMGGNVLLVRPERTEPLVGRTEAGGLANTLVPGDVEAILAAVPTVERISASYDGRVAVKYGSLTTSTSVRAVDPEYEQVRNFPAVRGRYFTEEEADAGLRVAVVGQRVVETLFEGSDPVGERIRIQRVPFDIVGVLEKRGASAAGGSDEDNMILIPLRTGMRRVFNVDFVTLLYVQVREEADVDEAADRITAVLRDRHRLDRLRRPDDFRVDNQLLLVQAERDAAASFQRLVTALASVALLVGGVGILSLMMLSLRERRAEVGLRVAVGAKRRDVRTQFMAEALILGAAGGLAGLFIGLAASRSIGNLTEWSTSVSASAVAIAVGSALAVSLVFGVLPAQRAASLDPIESLRAE